MNPNESYYGKKPSLAVAVFMAIIMVFMSSSAAFASSCVMNGFFNLSGEFVFSSTSTDKFIANSSVVTLTGSQELTDDEFQGATEVTYELFAKVKKTVRTKRGWKVTTVTQSLGKKVVKTKSYYQDGDLVGRTTNLDNEKIRWYSVPANSELYIAIYMSGSPVTGVYYIYDGY